MAEANCIPPDGLTDQGEINDDFIDDVTPDDEQPAQDDLEDWNYNYVNNDQDPTNRLDADGNILAAPLEIWEIQSPTTVTIPAEGRIAPTGRPGTTRYVALPNEVQLNYYPYGNNQIPAGTPVFSDAREQVIDGVTYYYRLQEAITGVQVQGYSMLGVRRNATTQGDATVIGFADLSTGQLISVWDFRVNPSLSPVFPERHPWFGYNLRKDPNIDLGTLDQDPFQTGVLPNIRTNSPYQQWVDGKDDFDVTSKFSGLLPYGYVGLPFNLKRDWTETDLTDGTKIMSWIGFSQDYNRSPDFPGAFTYDNTNEAGWEKGEQYFFDNRRFSDRFRDMVFWFEVPSDVTTGGTIDVNFFYPDRRKLERWMYANKGMPIGLLDRHGYQTEYRNRYLAEQGTRTSASRNPQPDGGFWHGIQPISRHPMNTFARSGVGQNKEGSRFLQGRVVFSPSGNRMATTLAFDGFPVFHWYESQPNSEGLNPKRKTTPNVPEGLTKNGSSTSLIVIYDLINGEWEISNAVTDPLFYGADFGPIEDDGSIRTYSGSATPDLRENTHPIIEFTDENTIKATYFSQTYWEKFYRRFEDSFYIEEYSFDVTPGVGDVLPNGPAVISSSKTELDNQSVVNASFNPFPHPVAKEYADLEEANPGLLINTTRALKQPILYKVGLAPLGSVIKNIEAEYNGFRLISFPDAPLVPNLSTIYGGGRVPFTFAGINGYSYGKFLKLRYEYTHRRGFAGIGEVIAVDANDNIVYRFEPTDARDWVKFQDGENGGRIIGRPMFFQPDVSMPEDDVSSDNTGVKSVGAFLHFGQEMHVSGSTLWVSQNWYKGDQDVTLADPSVYQGDNGGTPADSDKLWEKSGWYKIDLSTIPELNP